VFAYSPRGVDEAQLADARDLGRLVEGDVSERQRAAYVQVWP
jgi:hypothetical protein